MSDPVYNLPSEYTQRGWQVNKEARLEEIREQAKTLGTVESKGIKPTGAPFPLASPQTGYYGIPLLKQPQWKPVIPLYFFVGGAAGAASVVGAFAHWTGRDEKIAHDARLLSAAGALLSIGLLISDLGRPARFLNMLRVFKPQSPMSMGAWALAGFGTFSSAAASAQILSDRYDLGAFRILGNVAEGFSALFGVPISNYTGLLIGATVIPVWNHNVRSLPFHFGMSGLNAGVSTLELMGNDSSSALNRLAILSSAAESYTSVVIELKRDPVVNKPLKHGSSGLITRMGELLSGPLPLALRIAAEFTGKSRSRQLRRIAASSSIAGSFLTRIGWIRAGSISAKDWRLPLRQEKQPNIPEMQSRADLQRLRKTG